MMSDFKPGEVMINFFNNKSLVKKIMSYYPKNHPQYIWLNWGIQNSYNMKKEFYALTKNHWPNTITAQTNDTKDFIKHKKTVKYIRFLVLSNLLKDEERTKFIKDEIKEDESLLKFYSPDKYRRSNSNGI